MVRLMWQYSKFIIYPIAYLLGSPLFVMYLGIEDALNSLKEYQQEKETKK